MVKRATRGQVVALSASCPPADDEISIRMEGEGRGHFVVAGYKISGELPVVAEGGVEGAAGVVPGDTEVDLARRLLEPGADEDLAVGLESEGIGEGHAWSALPPVPNSWSSVPSGR